MILPTILCGGAGTRLWPLSRRAYPKQFVKLLEDRSLLAATFDRVWPFLDQQGSILCVGAEDYRFIVASEAADHGYRATQLLEPAGRNTAASIALAALYAKPGCVLLCCPADHYIPDAARFRRLVEDALPAAVSGAIVTFGISPTFPSTDYGYIQAGEKLSDEGFAVKRFVEKPDRPKAEGFISEGGFYWNAGIFLADRDVLIEQFRIHAPKTLSICQGAMDFATIDGDFVRPDKDIFSTLESVPFDVAVMEKTTEAVMFPFEGQWSDVGTWAAVAELAPVQTDQGNGSAGAVGKVHHVGSTHTYVHAAGGRPVVTLGTSDLLVIDAPDALLVADRKSSAGVREVVDRLAALDVSEALQHRTVARPWGSYDTIEVGPRYQVKKLVVKPGASLSLQSHRHRAEHWIVVSGVATVTVGEETRTLLENQSTYIPMGEKHRLANLGTSLLELIEVQSGSYLGEDDIVRYEDKYGRS